MSNPNIYFISKTLGIYLASNHINFIYCKKNKTKVILTNLVSNNVLLISPLLFIEYTNTSKRFNFFYSLFFSFLESSSWASFLWREREFFQNNLNKKCIWISHTINNNKKKFKSQWLFSQTIFFLLIYNSRLFNIKISFYFV